MQSSVEAEVISVEQNVERRSISIFAVFCSLKSRADQNDRGAGDRQPVK
jgi:hypothetical protein